MPPKIPGSGAEPRAQDPPLWRRSNRTTKPATISDPSVEILSETYDANLRNRSDVKSARNSYFRADEAGRRAMIEELGDRSGKGTSPDDAVERLAVLHAKEADPALKEEILDALAWIASGTAFDSILGILRDAADDEQRAAAATALELVISDLANAGDWERVARGLEADLPTALRVTTVETLMMEGDAAAVPRLQKLLGDPDAEVREAAVHAVEALAEPR